LARAQRALRTTSTTTQETVGAALELAAAVDADKRDIVHQALRLAVERGAPLDAIHELMSIERDWSGIVDDDKIPASNRTAPWGCPPSATASTSPRGHA
jgi:hypothetical protein